MEDSSFVGMTKWWWRYGQMAAESNSRDDILSVVHETAAGMFEVGAIDARTMREFDEMRLTPVHDFGSDDIRALREREQVSQAVFARYLNVNKCLASQWERGEKRPAGPSLKLLALVEHKGLAAIR
jgi:putative transcriptional regulator